MAGPLETFLTADHARLDALLTAARRSEGTIDAQVYAEFRRGLLQHIAMEEKILLPYARSRGGGELPAIAAALRKDHGDIAALLVPSPTPALCAELKVLLVRHNSVEEGRAGLYAICDALAGAEADEVVERLKAQPPVPVAPHYDGPLLRKRPGSTR